MRARLCPVSTLTCSKVMRPKVHTLTICVTLSWLSCCEGADQSLSGLKPTVYSAAFVENACVRTVALDGDLQVWEQIVCEARVSTRLVRMVATSDAAAVAASFADLPVSGMVACTGPTVLTVERRTATNHLRWSDCAPVAAYVIGKIQQAGQAVEKLSM